MNRFFERFTQLLVLWVLLLVGWGYFWPRTLVVLKPQIEWFFAFTMFGIGMVLSLEDFQPIFKKPQLVFLGTLTQFSIMPALGCIIAKLLRLPADLAVGVILVGAVPGAMASNVISYLARADVAYSVALTSASTFLSPLLTPLFTYIFAHTFIEIKFWQMVFSIVKMVILPLLLGIGIKHIFKTRLNRIISLFPAISVVFIAFICGLVVALNRNYLKNITPLIFLAVFLHNFWGLVLGYGAGKLYGFGQKRCRTLSIEVGMQNAGLGAVLALKHFSAQSAIANAFFAIWCIITASVLAEIWARKSAS
ncbi:MAG: bile acid:sodium symporter family protein [Candidatus Omnitrophica bacterium]|nr:bile acid:sodium symporter family protein [Candidatus Omnitrophota bacterium]